jgi:hypothetical protein
MTPCNFVDGYQRFGGTYRLHHQDSHFYPDPEEYIPDFHCRENLKPHRPIDINISVIAFLETRLE